MTTAINKLYNQAESEQDHATTIMLEDFINEQVEEEATIACIVTRLKLAKDSAAGLLLLNHELGKKD